MESRGRVRAGCEGAVLLALFLSVPVLPACGGGGDDGGGVGDEPAGRSEPPRTGRNVLEEMVRAHRGTRYRTLTFVQRTVRFPSGDAPPDTSTWYEALAPGRLRIDVAPWREGNGVLYRDGIRFTIRGGEPADSARDRNPLAVLLSDVFHQPVERSVAVLDSLGFDLSLVRRDTLRDELRPGSGPGEGGAGESTVPADGGEAMGSGGGGTPVWVVGASAGDTTSARFWVDRERLLPVRVVQPVGPDSVLLDARIGGYHRIDGSWVESAIDIYLDGRLAQTETYREIRVNPELPADLFDPGSWSLERPYWR